MKKNGSVSVYYLLCTCSIKSSELGWSQTGNFKTLASAKDPDIEVKKQANVGFCQVLLNDCRIHDSVVIDQFVC